MPFPAFSRRRCELGGPLRTLAAILAVLGVFGPAFIEVLLARLRRAKQGDGDE